MSIKMDTYCFQCCLNRNLDLVRPLGTEEQATAFAREMMSLWLQMPRDAASPWVGPGTADLLHKHYGLPVDRYREDREQSNRFVMERMDQIRQTVQSAPDPVYAGLQMAVLGNYLDFNALQGQVSFEKLDEMLRVALDMDLDRENYIRFRRDLDRAKNLLWITDNAGEIGFDRVAAEAVAAQYPRLSITFLVRGAITANDASREDAEAVGIPFPVIDNGSRIAGTQMDQLGREAQAAFDTADVILAKGMGNTETMLGCGYNVYYAFLIKCQQFVNIFGKPMMTPMFVRDRDVLNE